MSFSKSTPNYGLPDYELSDTPDWVSDIAQAFVKIDMVMKGNADGVMATSENINILNSALDTIRTSIDNLEELVGGIPEGVAQLRAEVTSLKQEVGTISSETEANNTAVTNLVAQFKTFLDRFAIWENQINDFRTLQVSAVSQLFAYNDEQPNETGEPLFALKTDIPTSTGMIFKRVDKSKITKNNNYPIPTNNIAFSIDINDVGIIFGYMNWPTASPGRLEVGVNPGLSNSFRQTFDALGGSYNIWFPYIPGMDIFLYPTNSITGSDFDNMLSESSFSIFTMGGA